MALLSDAERHRAAACPPPEFLSLLAATRLPARRNRLVGTGALSAGGLN